MKESSSAQIECKLIMRVEVDVKFFAEWATEEELLGWLAADKNHEVLANEVLSLQDRYAQEVGWLDDNRQVLMGDIVDSHLLSVETIQPKESQAS